MTHVIVEIPLTHVQPIYEATLIAQGTIKWDVIGGEENRHSYNLCMYTTQTHLST